MSVRLSVRLFDIDILRDERRWGEVLYTDRRSIYRRRSSFIFLSHPANCPDAIVRKVDGSRKNDQKWPIFRGFRIILHTFLYGIDLKF